jgi:hypothetical protein
MSNVHKLYIFLQMSLCLNSHILLQISLLPNFNIQEFLIAAVSRLIFPILNILQQWFEDILGQKVQRTLSAAHRRDPLYLTALFLLLIVR